MKIQIFIFISFLTIISCTSKTTTNSIAPEYEPNAFVPPPINPFDTLPIFPEIVAKMLFDKQDVLSINFLNGASPITVYGEDQSRSLLAGLLSYNRPANPICQNPLATFSSSGKGQALAQGSIFFQQGCTYLIFQDIETNQYTFICQMGNNGINTLNQILQNQAQPKQNPPSNN